jgi:hypothetical protein
VLSAAPPPVAAPLQEKAALKAAKDAAEAKYKVAYVDDRPEQVRAQQLSVCDSVHAECVCAGWLALCVSLLWGLILQHLLTGGRRAL